MSVFSQAFSLQAAPASLAPAQAIAEGFTVPVLMDEFTDMNGIAPNGQTSTTATLYNTFAFDGGGYAPGQLTQSGSVLTIMPPNSGNSTYSSNGNVGLMSFIQRPGGTVQLSTHGNTPANTGNGKIFKYGYFEARIAFDSSIPSEVNGRPGWYAFCWSGIPGAFAGTQYSSEIDFMESFGASNSVSSTVHEWGNPVSGQQTGNGFPRASQQQGTGTNQIPTSSAGNGTVDGTMAFSTGTVNGALTFNTYGCLWTSTKISFWWNNRCIGFIPLSSNEATQATSFGSPLACGYSSNISDCFNFLTLGTGNLTIYVDFIHVWQ